MKVIDISRVIEPAAAVYPGDDPLEAAPVCEIGSEAPCNITGLVGWTTHFLTHVDPPRHFFPAGQTLDEIPLERFIGAARVVHVEGDAVTAEDLPTDLRAGANVLIKTRNSSTDPHAFDEAHVYLDVSAVEALVTARVNLVGFDYLSVDRFGDEDYPAHRGLLAADILVLEGLDLSAVQPGEYRLLAMPLRIKGGDGSPVRAVLEV